MYVFVVVLTQQMNLLAGELLLTINKTKQKLSIPYRSQYLELISVH